MCRADYAVAGWCWVGGGWGWGLGGGRGDQRVCINTAALSRGMFMCSSTTAGVCVCVCLCVGGDKDVTDVQNRKLISSH